jgi:hypothetical protein
MSAHGPSSSRRQRILVVANQTVASDALRDFVSRRSAGNAEVAVVAPALNSRLRHWTSDDRQAREAADERLGRCLESLHELGVEARGFVGDADPLQAIDDALRRCPADEIIIATHPEGRSNWLARNIVDRARSRYGTPIHHTGRARRTCRKGAG